MLSSGGNMKKKLCILTVFILMLSASAAFTAGNSSTFVNEKESQEENSFESCGKNSEKGCKKDTKKKFKNNKSPVIKPETQK